MSNPLPVRYGKQVARHLEAIADLGYSFSDVFRDFVDLCLSATLSLCYNLSVADFETFMHRMQHAELIGPYEERYLAIMSKYKRDNDRLEYPHRPADHIKAAWFALQDEIQKTGQDVLGEIYEARISIGEHGQFFTPDALVQVINEVIIRKGHETDMIEPACGSGRLIIDRARRDPDLWYHGTDISPICARMTALNMYLFDINADIYEGDSMTLKDRYLWKIRRGGFISEARIDYREASAA